MIHRVAKGTRVAFFGTHRFSDVVKRQQGYAPPSSGVDVLAFRRVHGSLFRALLFSGSFVGVGGGEWVWRVSSRSVSTLGQMQRLSACQRGQQRTVR